MEGRALPSFIDSVQETSGVFTCATCGCVKSILGHGAGVAYARRRLKKERPLYCGINCSNHAKKKSSFEIECVQCGLTREVEGMIACGYRRRIKKGILSFCDKKCGSLYREKAKRGL